MVVVTVTVLSALAMVIYPLICRLLGLPPELAGNIEHTYYPAGHMMYLHEASRRQQSQDLGAFVRRASGS